MFQTLASASNGNPHVFQSAEYFIDKSVIFRFEDREADEILYHSSFSEPSIAIASDTELIESDIYEEEGAFELPMLEWVLNPPSGFVVKQEPFDIAFSLVNPDGSPFPSDGVSYNPQILDDPEDPNDPYCTFMSSAPADFPHTFTYLAGDIPFVFCEYSVGTTLADDTDLPPSDNIFINIVDVTEQLMLEQPFYGETLVGVTNVDLIWNALNAPANALFNLEVFKDGVRIFGANGPEIAVSPKNIPVGIGQYDWTVEMLETGETKSASFDVSQDVVVNFAANVSASPDSDPQNATTIGTLSMDDNVGDFISNQEYYFVDFSANDAGDGFSYNWTGAEFNDPIIINPAFEFPLLPGGSVDYNIIFDVINDETGNLVGSKVKTITVAREAIPTIETIAFNPPPPTSINQGNNFNDEIILNQNVDVLIAQSSDPDAVGQSVKNDCKWYLDDIEVTDPVNTVFSPEGDHVVECKLFTAGFSNPDYILPADVTTGEVVVNVVAPMPTLAVTSPQSYYEVNTDVPFTIENLDFDDREVSQERPHLIIHLRQPFLNIAHDYIHSILLFYIFLFPFSFPSLFKD